MKRPSPWFTPVPGDTYEEEEDESRVRRDHAPANFNTLRQFALNPPRRESSTLDLKRKRCKAVLDDPFRAKVVFGH